MYMYFRMRYWQQVTGVFEGMWLLYKVTADLYSRFPALYGQSGDRWVSLGTTSDIDPRRRKQNQEPTVELVPLCHK